MDDRVLGQLMLAQASAATFEMNSCVHRHLDMGLKVVQLVCGVLSARHNRSPHLASLSLAQALAPLLKPAESSSYTVITGRLGEPVDSLTHPSMQPFGCSLDLATRAGCCLAAGYHLR
jgi:hypothetical protein